ncbi:thioredoxin family protein [Salinicola halophyticus]|uniref:thioredoxin family protein n=1 Tax=Salinicola halophyticus TaxID=1808881 RepID=UPI000DA14122|nr:thioredoxin domain-containing protein [Salinicola halophyticus]
MQPQRRHLDNEAFERQREERAIPWLAVFVADWCQPCETLLSRLSSAPAGPIRDLAVGVVDVDREPALAERYGIKGTPTLILFIEGEPRLTRVGALSEAQLLQIGEESTRN